MIHRIEFKGEGDSVRSRLLIDGNPVAASGIVIEQFAGEMATAVIHLPTIPCAELYADVMYFADEEGVETATRYLRESVEKDEALRDEFQSRILSAIDKLGNSFDCEELAHKILDMIFVEESR